MPRRSVRAVLLEIGALSHVEEQALRFCFDAVTRGTVADGARLDVLATPGRAWCMPCAKAWRSHGSARPVPSAAATSCR